MGHDRMRSANLEPGAAFPDMLEGRRLVLETYASADAPNILQLIDTNKVAVTTHY